MTDKQPPHVQQAMNEMEGASNAEQRRAAEKRLAAFGVTVERAATARKKAAGEPDDETKVDRAPQGRRTPTKQQG
jgi:hypothetical protein